MEEEALVEQEIVDDSCLPDETGDIVGMADVPKDVEDGWGRAAAVDGDAGEDMEMEFELASPASSELMEISDRSSECPSIHVSVTHL